MEEKLKILKGYVHLLRNSNVEDNIHESYFIIIHNWLLIERMFQDEVTACSKELNNNLNIKKLDNVQDVLDLFYELYDVHHKVRFAVETFDSIEEVRQYLYKHPKVYSDFL
jgi:hypothetical protein